MNGASHQFLAGAALAADQNGRVAFGDLLDERSGPPHGLAFANDDSFQVELRLKAAILAAECLRCQNIFEGNRRDARNRCQEVNMIVLENSLGITADHVKDTERPLYSHQWGAKHTLLVLFGNSVGEQRNTLPQNLLYQFAAYLDLRSVTRTAMPHTARSRFFVGVTQHHNRGRFCWDNFANEFQQAMLQRRQLANGIDSVSDFEKCVQVARHPTHVGPGMRRGTVGANVRRGQIYVLIFSKLYCLVNLLLVLGNQEDQLAPSDTDRVSVRQELTTYRYSIDECTVVTFEIDEMKGCISFADREVTSRDGTIAQTEMVRGISPHGKLIALQTDHTALGRSRNNHNPGVQARLPSRYCQLRVMRNHKHVQRSGGLTSNCLPTNQVDSSDYQFG